MLEGEKATSCDLFRAEVASVIRKLVRAGKVAPEEAEGYFSKACTLVDEFVPIEEMQIEALSESVRLDHSTYDMFYFVLARRTGGTLFTLDRKLADLCMANGVNCIACMPFEDGR